MRRTIIFIKLSLVAVAYAGLIKPDSNNNVCENDQCKLVGEIINKVLKKEADPCEDFYEYACGNWEVNFPLPSTEDLWNIDKMIEFSAKLEVKEILEEEESPDDFAPLKYEKWWFKACMNSEKIEEVGVKPMLEIMGNFGGWPMLTAPSDWTDDNHEWQEIHEFYSNYRDFPSLFLVQVSSDDRDPSKNVIKLNKPGETLWEALLKRSARDEESATQKYAEFVKNATLILAGAAGKTITDDDLTKDVDDLVSFEKALHSIKVEANETEDLESATEYMTIDALQEYYDSDGKLSPTGKIKWLDTILYMFKKIENVTIDNLEEVEVKDKYFLRKLSRLLNEISNRVLVNYVHWKFITVSMKYSNKEMSDLYREVLTDPDDTSVIPERWEECRDDMGLRLGYRYEYVRRHYREDVKKLVSDIASELRGEMLDEIDHANWIDELTKEESAVKLRAMKWQSGNSNMLFNKEHLERLYDGLLVTSDYFENELGYREFHASRSLSKLRRASHPRRYTRVDPLRATALYDKRQNILALSSALLSTPLLHSSLPQSVNYGFIAPTMAQLMSRAMEKEVNTNLYMPPWSSYLGDTYKTYEAKTGCLIRQYYNYSVGEATLDENMYDAIGLKVAHNAFLNSYNVGSDEKLPGLEELNDDQLFFLSYALKYCHSSSDKYQLDHDPAFTTPSEYRVIGTLSNSEHFAKAFNCAPNSPMNPEEKCVV